LARTFVIHNGDSNELIKYLTATDYDGGTEFGRLSDAQALDILRQRRPTMWLGSVQAAPDEGAGLTPTWSTHSRIPAWKGWRIF
jgi:hypothetical protein